MTARTHAERVAEATAYYRNLPGADRLSEEMIARLGRVYVYLEDLSVSDPEKLAEYHAMIMAIGDDDGARAEAIEPKDIRAE